MVDIQETKIANWEFSLTDYSIAININNKH
jgi:hypothetical protein